MKKVILFAVIAVTLMTSCSSYTATGAGFGGMLGSAVGGILGGPRGSDIGTIIGVAAGATAGAAAEAQEQRRLEERAARVNDDVYYGDVQNDAKAARIQQYHNNVARKYSGNGYHLQRGTSDPYRSGSNYNSRSTSTTAAAADSSGYVDKEKYDDRIEMK